MKKRSAPIALLLAALLLLFLAACGGDESAPEEEPGAAEASALTEEPDAGETPAQAEEPDAGETPAPEPNALPAPYYLCFAPDKTAEYDLDGDGRAEEVRVWLKEIEEYDDEVCLSVNGEDLTETLYGIGDGFFCPDDRYWLITDLDTGDGMLEIAIQDWGPSDDLTTSFYRYGPDGLSYVGLVEGFVCQGDEPADVTFDGQGTVHSYMRFDVLQTWWGSADSALDRDGKLVLKPQKYYDSVAETPQQVTVNYEIYAWDAPGGERDLLPAGTQLELLGTDNVEWVLARLAGEKQELWLHLNPDYPFRLDGPEGFIDGWDALDGLCMAD